MVIHLNGKYLDDVNPGDILFFLRQKQDWAEQGCYWAENCALIGLKFRLNPRKPSEGKRESASDRCRARGYKFKSHTCPGTCAESFFRVEEGNVLLQGSKEI